MIPGELDTSVFTAADSLDSPCPIQLCRLHSTRGRDRPTVFCRLSTGNGFRRLRVTEQAAVDRAIGAYRQDVGDR